MQCMTVAAAERDGSRERVVAERDGNKEKGESTIGLVAELGACCARRQQRQSKTAAERGRG